MPQNAQPLLQVSDLTKSYEGKRGAREQHHALSGVDFACGEGELVAVIGPSGAGKSTFLRCINRLIEPTEGSVVFNGRDITHLRRNKLRGVRAQIAMIFQNYNLVYRLTAIQNVLHGRLGYKGAVAGSLGLYSEAEKLRAFELLDEVGLGEFAYRRADQLSGGQKQRVGIARALIQDPRIILCDEPIASLDPKSSRAVMEHLRRVTRQHGITCIVNLHQVDMALEFSDRIVGLRAGAKVFEGAPAELTPPDDRGDLRRWRRGLHFRSGVRAPSWRDTRICWHGFRCSFWSLAMSAGECGAMSTGSFGNAKAGKVPDLSWFRRRQLRALAVVAAVVLVAEGASLVGDFSFGYALGSVPAALAWMLQNFCPTPSSLGQLGIIATQVVSTVFDSIAATMLAALLGIVLAVLGCSSVGVENGIVRGVIRIFANIFRNVPMIAWALLLLLSFKQNEFTGFLALFLATFGQITRFFLDTLDEIPCGPIEALRSCGASFWQIVFQAGLPLAVAELMSWTLYMVETNIREATLVGLLTGTGIGFAFNLYYASFRYDCAGLVILVTIVLVLVVEAISNAARRSMI